MLASILEPTMAGIVPARLTEDGWRLLVVKERRAWEFPNGSMAPGEDPVKAAESRTRQGTGLTDLRFPFGLVFRDPAPNSRGRYPRYYLAVTQQERIELTPAGDDKRPEHREARWVSFEDAAALLPQRLGPTLSWARRILSQKTGG